MLLQGRCWTGRSKVLPSSVAALKAALAKGVTVCLATGKARPAAMAAMSAVGLAGAHHAEAVVRLPCQTGLDAEAAPLLAGLQRHIWRPACNVMPHIMLRGLVTGSLDRAGEGLVVSNSGPGIFLQGLAVHGRNGELLPGDPTIQTPDTHSVHVESCASCRVVSGSPCRTVFGLNARSPYREARNAVSPTPPTGRNLPRTVVREAFAYAEERGVPLCAFLGDTCVTLRMTDELRVRVVWA